MRPRAKFLNDDDVFVIDTGWNAVEFQLRVHPRPPMVSFSHMHTICHIELVVIVSSKNDHEIADMTVHDLLYCMHD